MNFRRYSILPSRFPPKRLCGHPSNDRYLSVSGNMLQENRQTEGRRGSWQLFVPSCELSNPRHRDQNCSPGRNFAISMAVDALPSSQLSHLSDLRLSHRTDRLPVIRPLDWGVSFSASTMTRTARSLDDEPVVSVDHAVPPVCQRYRAPMSGIIDRRLRADNPRYFPEKAEDPQLTYPVGRPRTELANLPL
jgi:hypothetical protein